MHEIKFTAGNDRAPMLIAWLRTVCRPDPDYPRGIVASIYYDTCDWRSLQSKVNSDYFKSKVRLRWYADADRRRPYDGAFIEAKLKIGCRRRKIRQRVTLGGARLAKTPLQDPVLLQLPRLLAQEGVITPAHLFPAFEVLYERWRFLEPSSGARICLDHDIQVPRVNPAMLPRQNPFDLATAVFEIKSTHTALPETLHPLTDMGWRKTSFSKYWACYQKVSGGNY